LISTQGLIIWPLFSIISWRCNGLLIDVAILKGQVVFAEDGADALAPAAARFQIGNNFRFVHGCIMPTFEGCRANFLAAANLKTFGSGGFR